MFKHFSLAEREREEGWAHCHDKHLVTVVPNLHLLKMKNSNFF